MDFEFSTEQEMLRSSVRSFLAEVAPISSVRSGARSDDVWKGLADLGVLGLLVPERYGGAGMGMVDAAVVLEELGRAVCPSPFLSSAIGAMPLLADLGDADADADALASLLDELVKGRRTGTVALFEPDRRYEWRVPATTATTGTGRTWHLDGTKVHVTDVDVAGGVLLATARDPDGRLGVFLARGDAQEQPTVDLTRHEWTVTLREGQRIGGGADATGAVARTLDRLGVAAVVDGVGAAQRALELAVEYAKERVQFGKPIGSFQAVQHLCADMLRTVELGRAAAYYACWALDEAPPEEAHRAAVLAQAFAADAFPQLGGTAIQVFGGIGFTWEHDIHLYYKRLLSQSVALGTANDYLAELAHLAID